MKETQFEHKIFSLKNQNQNNKSTSEPSEPSEVYEVYIGPIDNNSTQEECILNGNGIKLMGNNLNTQYFGDIKNNIFDGTGVLETLDNYIIGEFTHGSFTGLGKIKSKNNQIEISGNFVNGQLHGLGVVDSKSPSTSVLLSGFFENGKIDKLGVEINHKTGSKYTGEFKNGEKNGFAIIESQETKTLTNYFSGFFNRFSIVETFQDNERYSGELFNSKRNGEGLITCPKSNKFFLGNFKNGEISGLGKMIRDDWTYIGEYTEGLKDGIGYYIAANERYIYFGGFKSNKMQGNGIFFDLVKNLSYIGTWINGLKQGLFIVQASSDIKEGNMNYDTDEQFIEFEDDQISKKIEILKNENLEKIQNLKNLRLKEEMDKFKAFNQVYFDSMKQRVLEKTKELLENIKAIENININSQIEQIKNKVNQIVHKAQETKLYLANKYKQQIEDPGYLQGFLVSQKIEFFGRKVENYENENFDNYKHFQYQQKIGYLQSLKAENQFIKTHHIYLQDEIKTLQLSLKNSENIVKNISSKF